MQFSLAFIKELSKETLLELYPYLYKYKDIFNLNDTLMEEMQNILKDKIQNDNIIILNPNLDNLFNKEIYKLDFHNDTYYIPLWHSEITYDISSSIISHSPSSLIIKCVPSLPKNISIDHFNNIHINTQYNIQTLFQNIQTRDNDILSVSCGEKVFEIPISQLFIKKIKHIHYFPKVLLE